MKPVISTNEYGMPVIGFGTFDLIGNIEDIVYEALKQGYRLIDTAQVYGSEEGVGKAVKKAVEEGMIKRSDVYIETKLSHEGHDYYSTLRNFEESINKLQMDYVDMYLIHWPVPRGCEKNYKEKNIEIWNAFTDLKKQGKVKHIGVCNFLERHLLHLVEDGMQLPEVNQLELHPGYQQIGLVNFCREKGIAIEAWSPLGRGVLNKEEFIKMADRYQKNIGQLALRWSLQNGFIPLTRSSNVDHIKKNIEIFDFEINNDDMEILNALNSNDNFQQIWNYKRQQMY